MDALIDTVVSSAIGNAMLSNLVAVAGHLHNFGLDHGFKGLKIMNPALPRINLNSNEFNEVISDKFIPIFK